MQRRGSAARWLRCVAPSAATAGALRSDMTARVGSTLLRPGWSILQNGGGMMKNSIIGEVPERIRRHRRRCLEFKALVLVAAACTMASSIVVAGNLQEVIPWDIKAGTLDQALLQFGEEAHMQITFPWKSATAAVRTGEIKGKYTGIQLLDRLLKGTRFKYAVIGDTISIRPEARGKAAAPSRSAAQQIGLEGIPGSEESAVPTPSFRANETPPPAFLQEVVVTGTHIANVAPISPVVTISSEDIQHSGLPDIASVIRTLPQDFGGGLNPTVVVGGGINGGDSFSLPSTANLRGLGANATLTLLDGHRMAGTGNQAYVDLSSIPTAAVKRVEIETGGDSAIYGADAVAGVVNIILRRNYQGARTDAYVGTTADGGLTQRYSQLVGRSFRAGTAGLMVGYQYQSVSKILASQRLVSLGAGDATEIQPAEISDALFLSGHYAIDSRASGRIEGVYNRRSSLDLWDGLANQNRERQFDLNGDVTVHVGDTGTMALDVTWSGDSSYGLDYQPFVGKFAPADQQVLTNRILEIALSAQGQLVRLPGRRVLRYAAGVGNTQETLDGGFPATARQGIVMGRRKQHAYLELNLPIVPASDGRVGLERLDVDAAWRFEHYGDFGSIGVPKVGISYVPVTDFEVSGSWGRSYQPPTLYDLSGGQTLIWEPGAYFIGVPPGKSVLLLSGSNPKLRAQTAVTRTVTVQWKPSWKALRGFVAGASYFDINFSSGINAPITNFTEAVSSPEFAPYVVQSPSASLQSAVAATATRDINPLGLSTDPVSVQALVFDTMQNVSQQMIHGVDGNLSYTRATVAGLMTLRVDGTWESFDQKALPGSAPTAISGTIFNPPRFKARAQLGWERRGWGANLFVNYVSSENNNATVPVTRIPSWTTIDGQVRYAVRKFEVSFSVQNLLNTPPPALSALTAVIPPGIGFDADNYSALGRFAALEAGFAW